MEGKGGARREGFGPGDGGAGDAARGDEDGGGSAGGDRRAVEIADLSGADSGRFGVALALDGEGFPALAGEEVDTAVAGPAAVFDLPAVAPEPAGDLGFEVIGVEGAEAFEGASGGAAAEEGAEFQGQDCGGEGEPE